MRTDAPSPGELAGARFHVEAHIWLGDSPVTRLPVRAGALVWQADQAPAVQASGVVVPRLVGGRDLYAEGVVGSNGHRVRLVAHGEHGQERWQWDLATLVVTRVVAEGAGLSLDGAGLELLVEEHQGAMPGAVHGAMRIADIARGLFREDGVELVVDPALEGVRVPANFSIGTDRGATLEELVTAWGAYLVPGRAGTVAARPVPERADSPAARFREGVGGTIIDAALTLERSQIYNHVCVEVEGEERVAQAAAHTGRYAVGQFGWRTRRVQSRAISNYAQAQLVARTELVKGLRRSVTVPVEAVPDWRVEPYETVAVEADGVTGLGQVTGIEWPLTHEETAVFHVGMEV